MYVRAKFINGEYYYYLVKSERVGGRTIQRTLSYLGKREEAVEYAKKHGLKVVEPKPKLPGAALTKLDELIELKKKRLESLKISQAVEKRFREDLTTVWTYNSTGIEGSTLSLKETELFLHEGIVAPNKPFQDHLDAKGHADAVQLVFLWLEKNRRRPVEEIDVLNLHKTVMYGREDTGRYRKVQVYIRGSSHVPPPASQVPKLMKEFVRAVNENPRTLPFIAQIAVSHADFEAIHPFVDGNGRVGRLLANWMLMKKGYPPIIIELHERKKYFRYLELAQTRNNVTSLVWFFKSKLNVAYDFYLKRVDPKYEEWSAKISKIVVPKTIA